MSSGMYSPSPDPFLQFRDSQGRPLSGGRLYTYLAGTSSPATTYSDVGLTTANPNPIILASDGTNPQGSVFLVPGQSYRYVLQDAYGNVVWVRDNIMVESGQGTTPAPPPTSSLVDQGAGGTSPWLISGTVGISPQPIDVNIVSGGGGGGTGGTVNQGAPGTQPWPMTGTMAVVQPVQVVGVSGGQPLPITGSVAVSQPVQVSAPSTAPLSVTGNVTASVTFPSAQPVTIIGQPVAISGAISFANAQPVTISGQPVQVVGVSGGQPLPVTGTVAVSQPVLVNQGTPAVDANSWPVHIIGSGGGGGAVTIADGADVAEGSRADVAATSGTGTFTVVSLLKGILTKVLGSLSVTFPSAQPVTVPTPLSVNFPSAQLVTFPSAQPVSGTITANQGAPIADASSWPVHTVGAVTLVQPIQVGPTAGTPLSVTFPSTQQVSVQNTPGVNQGTPAADVSSWPIHQIPTPGLQRISMSATGVGDNILVTGSAGNKVYVYGIWGVANGAMSIFFKDGASSGLTGTMALITSQQILLGTRVNPWFVTSTGNSFLINVSTGANLAGAIWFVIGP